LSYKTNREYILDDLDHHDINSPTSPYYDRGDKRNITKHDLSMQGATPPKWIKFYFIEPNPYPYSGSQKSRHAEGKSIFLTIFGSMFKVTQQE
jgi:hypothetical protein